MYYDFTHQHAHGGKRPVPRWPSRVMLKKSRQEKRRVFGGIGCKSSTRTDVLIPKSRTWSQWMWVDEQTWPVLMLSMRWTLQLVSNVMLASQGIKEVNAERSVLYLSKSRPKGSEVVHGMAFARDLDCLAANRLVKSISNSLSSKKNGAIHGNSTLSLASFHYGAAWLRFKISRPQRMHLICLMVHIYIYTYIYSVSLGTALPHIICGIYDSNSFIPDSSCRCFLISFVPWQVDVCVKSGICFDCVSICLVLSWSSVHVI